MLDSPRYMQGRIIERIDFSNELAVFRVEPEEPVDFLPGQYATLALPNKVGRPTLRPYSIASAPHEPFLEFFVELVEGGDLTPRLWSMKSGERVWIRKRVVGHFVLDTGRARRSHVMAATVTGIAPFVSMIRAQEQALRAGERQRVDEYLVLHGASRSWELGFYLDELRETARQTDWLTYVPTVSRPWDDTEWSGEVGRCEDVLRKHMDRQGFTAANSIGYACGHPQMIDKVKGILARTGFSKEHVHEEKYFQDAAANQTSDGGKKRGPSPQSVTLRSVPPSSK